MTEIILKNRSYPPKYLYLDCKFTDSETKLNAHHVQKKIVKLKMDKRPIKHRLSDINRKNVNLNKCITKVVGAPADYTIVSAEG